MVDYMRSRSMLGFKHRSRVIIIKDILKSTWSSKEGSKKTQIMQSANLNYHQVNKYLRLLMVNDLLYVDNEDRYRITDRGLEFVKLLDSLHLKLR
jgi:predicted transcriptional regulator